MEQNPQDKLAENTPPLPLWKRPAPPRPEPVSVDLWYPIKSFGQDVKTLKCENMLDGFGLRELRGLAEEDKALKLIEVLYRTPEDKPLSFDDVCHLKGDDIRRLGEAALPFAGGGLEI